MTELELEDSFIGFEIEDTYDTELDEEEYTIEDQLQLQALTSIEFEETEFEEGSGINFNVPYESEFPATNEPKPGRFYKIQYGKGGLLTTAQRAYKTKSKAERLKRAQQINNHPLNRKFWRKPDNSFEKKSPFHEGLFGLALPLPAMKNSGLLVREKRNALLQFGSQSKKLILIQH